MAVEYRRLTENELEVFIDMRIDQLWEEGAKEDIDLKPALREYYNRHMADGNCWDKWNVICRKTALFWLP